MLVLSESSIGFALFSVTDEGKIGKDDLYKDFESPESANNLLKLKAIHRFSSTADAVEDLTQLQDGKLSKVLSKFLVDEITGSKSKKGKAVEETLVVSDTKLGGAISKKLGIKVVSDSTTMDLYRGIREQLTSLLKGLDPKDLATMNLGLSHSLSRFKLKFSPDKVDTMIIQAIALLDDLDKEINIYSMRTKEWYGWHFPEMGKIIVDNLAYAKVVRAMGFRTNASTTSFETILPEDLEATLKQAAELSMGTEISESDINHIHSLCDQVIAITEYRAQLYEYLKNRMAAIAPNLTALVGELVGARLISHAGSLLNLAKHPASTIQILGAEKALFRALKTKHDTPKYGLIYHASLIGQAPQKLKGKMARMVATKTALSIRVDALMDNDSKSDDNAPTIGVENRAKLESRLRALEHRLGIVSVRSSAADGRKQNKFEMTGNGAKYNDVADATELIATQPAATPAEEGAEKKEKKDKKKRKSEAGDGMDVDEATNGELSKEEKKRLKKEAKEAAKAAANGDASEDSSPKKEKKSKKRSRPSS
ncbi:nop domain-containing protein [Phaffia rhodozyma]|uniref:Nucleolar protein 58 n=1 Tax=Phaffia rhodozyma TaxID=264483 RepID=A0A0F7SHJ1_PHARH|nr:nop domain-containing protein [Phaffia rhodozyma]